MDQFDPNIPTFITGDITSVKVIEIPEYGLANRVINPTKELKVEVAWEVRDLLAPLWISALALNAPPGNWVVSVYAESLGGGPEVLLGTALVPALPLTSSTPPIPYTATVVVPPPVPLPEGDPGSDISGIYKLIVSVFLDSTFAAPGFDMIGFYEGPIVQVEDVN